ncbi:MAG: hypothetical protein JRJ49_03465 [Deltaproteobacteria bacterium]|nr:hypothetical protein [Deltaproteobacteria bacterium]
MKSPHKIIIFLILLIFINIFNLNAAEPVKKILKIQTILPFEIEKTASAESKFVGLTDEAINLNLNKIILTGKISYEKINDKKTRTKINWNGISLRQGTQDKTRSLTLPLFSQFSTSDKRVEPIELSASGDFESLLRDVAELLKQDETPKHLVEKTTEQVQDNTSNNDLSPDYSGSGGSSSASGGDTDSDFSANLISTSWEPCDPLIDFEKRLVYLQAKKIETGSSGTREEGFCEDYGGTIPIEATFEGCGFRHDFSSDVSIKKEKLFYRDVENIIYLTECQDSKLKYPQYETKAGCSPSINSAQGIVIPQSRIAYKIGNMEYYASDCRASETDQYEIRENFCDDKFEHDFINNVSYYKTYDYYVDGFGKVNKINECSRSSSASFSHIFETAECGVTNNDELMQTQFRSLRQIETPDGVINISECQDQSSPVAYVPFDTTEKTKEYTTPGKYSFTVPAGINKIYLIVKGADGGGVADQEKCRSIPGTGGDQGPPKQECSIISGSTGKAGEQKNETLTVTGNQVISLKIAEKGKFDSDESGGDSQFGDLIAKGGGPGGSGGSGRNGSVIIRYYETKYKRGDGSIYDPHSE